MTIGNNTANFNTCADWDEQNGNVTTVGTNGGPSAYGTYDQAGNAYQWNDLDGTSGSFRGLKGGSWGDAESIIFLSSSISDSGLPSAGDGLIGFRLSSSFSTLNPLSLSNFVTVGDINNDADTGGEAGSGSVSYSYAIGKYLVTNTEYRDFLTAVAETNTYGLYSTNMAGARGGITRSGSSGSYTYTIKTNYGNKPVVFVSWFDCARYCNWLHNGKPSGSQNSSTTEDGAYTLNGIVNGNAPAKNAGAKYHIPTEDEWYKAAYYKGGGTDAGYWAYATQSNSDPVCVSANSVGDGPGSGDLGDSTPTPTPSITLTQSLTPTTTPTLTTTITPTPTSTLTVTPTTTTTPTTTPTPTPSKPPIVGCDHKILKLYIPNSVISPGGTRASSIQLRIGGGTCCSRSNIRDIIIPALPPEPEPPQPEVCLAAGTDLYGYTAIVSYDPVNCAAGHSCNRAIFDFYIDENLIGRANLNNGGDGGYRESAFTINQHIISSVLTELKLVCALAACHNGVGRVVLKDPSNSIVLAVCMPNDVVVAGSFICPSCPKVLGSTHNIAENALNTSIQVNSGSRLTISADGTIDVGWPAHPGGYGPDGIPGIGNEPVLGFPYVSLLGRIGQSGTVFLVGSSYDSVVNESGELYLFFYDPQPGDNTGFFNACVTQPIV